MITSLDLQRAIARVTQVRSLRTFVGIADCYELNVITTGRLRLLHVCCGAWGGWGWSGTPDARSQFVDGVAALIARITPIYETATLSRCEHRGAGEIDWTKPLGPRSLAQRCTCPGLLVDDRVGAHTTRHAVCSEHSGDAGRAIREHVREHPHAYSLGWPHDTP